LSKYIKRNIWRLAVRYDRYMSYRRDSFHSLIPVCQTTRCHVREEVSIVTERYDNLKSHSQSVFVRSLAITWWKGRSVL